MLGVGFRKKTNRSNLRKKMTQESDEEQDLEADCALLKPKKNKQKTVLSFHDELDNNETFVVKKTKASATLENQVKHERKMKKKKSKLSEKPVLKSSSIEIKTFSDEEDLNESEFGVSHKFNLNKGWNAGIPDASMIYAMKKKRVQARQLDGQVNYIPLNANSHEGRYSTANSRLVRDEMDDSSDDDRMEMKGTCIASHPELERRKKVAKALEEVQDEEDEGATEEPDAEIQRWEDEQIKKGSQMPIQQSNIYGPKLPTTLTNPYSQSFPLTSNNVAYSQGYMIPTVDSQDYSVDMVLKQLNEQLDSKKQVHRIHDQEYQKVTFNLQSSKDHLVELEMRAAEVSDRFTFYQDIRGFVRNLMQCLCEKIKKINDLETWMHQTLKKRSDRIINRRQNDVRDEAEEVLGKTNCESERINNIKSRRRSERIERRARRCLQRQGREHYDGMSSDDEDHLDDVEKYQAEFDKITHSAGMIFEDVITDFSEIREITTHFEQWKFGFADSYKEAYLAVCLPKLFTPYITLQLLNWNPLKLDNPTDFEQMEWFQTLALYGEHGGSCLDTEDEDIKLLPNIIEKVLIPKLTALVKDVWDPLSSKQTKLLTVLFQRLVDDYPTMTKESVQTKVLVEAIVAKLKHAVETDLYIPLYPSISLEGSNSPSLHFLERQFFKGLKLLGNLMEWNWLLSQKKLQELGVDAILNRYLMIALQQFPSPMNALERVKLIANVLPKEWFEKSENIIPGLQCLARYLVSLANKVYMSSLGYSDTSEKQKSRVLIKKIISQLMHIQAFDEAKTVANEYKQ